MTFIDKALKAITKLLESKANTPSLEIPRAKTLKRSILNTLASFTSRNCSSGELIVIGKAYLSKVNLERATSAQTVLGKCNTPAANTLIPPIINKLNRTS
jgi:hypothetical protein